ncbi:hypothetical protein H2200_010014 [Cladophialophora chaetospira]|uniref:Uncharacterized protein n=1 Tax=Cladophialophora chaetospira TaxID=386627 RepID=A0AA38X2A4_9EURO|nr:hypothetical protein H2200_010014 [Cladophialophora chaetospira]
MPSTKVRSRPQMYPRVAFHVVRSIAFISASIVLAATLLSLITLLLNTILYSCFFLSPLFSLVLNTTILVLYVVGYGLLTWNIYGTLGHACSRANWASDDGMMVCRTYKAFYSFEVFGLLAQIALIVLDVRSRHTQIRLGKYKNMGDVGAKAVDNVKLDDLHHRSVDERPAMHRHGESQDSVPYGVGDYNDSRARLRDNAGDLGYGHAPPVRMEDFRNPSSTSGYSYNSSYAPQSGYANSGYGYGPQR